MNSETNDQEWQKLQARIEGLLKQCLAGGSGIGENKPQPSVPFLTVPAAYLRAEHQDVS